MCRSGSPGGGQDCAAVALPGAPIWVSALWAGAATSASDPWHLRRDDIASRSSAPWQERQASVAGDDCHCKSAPESSCSTPPCTSRATTVRTTPSEGSDVA